LVIKKPFVVLTAFLYLAVRDERLDFAVPPSFAAISQQRPLPVLIKRTVARNGASVQAYFFRFSLTALERSKSRGFTGSQQPPALWGIASAISLRLR
jgi:hypothetical protein